MKILYISPRYTGGVGGHALFVAEKLREEGFHVDIMRAPHLPIMGIKNFTFAISSTIKAVTAMGKYDIAHAYNVPSAFAMKCADSKKKILSVHGVYSTQIRILHSKLIAQLVLKNEKRVLKWADLLLTDSKTTNNQYRTKGINFSTIYGPINILKLDQIKNRVVERKKKVVFVGRNSFEKGIDILQKAEPYINADVTYCTDMTWERAMTIMKSSDIVVVPSRVESSPTVIKEAFYLGVPVIGTNIAGIAEIITNNKNGILVSPNDPKNLAKSTNHLLENSECRARLADAGRDFVLKNFTWDSLRSKYINLYENILSK